MAAEVDIMSLNAMLQSLKNRPELIENYSQIIVDEAHHIPAVPLKKFRGKYVVGLSATPKRQDGMHPIMYMQCGDIVHKVKRDKEQIYTLKTVRTKFEAYENEFTLWWNGNKNSKSSFKRST